MGSTADQREQLRAPRYTGPTVRDYGTLLEMTESLGLYGQYSSFLTGEPPPPSSTPQTPCRNRDGC